jgi:hypothetical protein
MAMSFFLNQGTRMASPGVAIRYHASMVVEGLAPRDPLIAR